MPSRWTAAQIPDQTGRTVVVTGASSGLGRVTAAELARAGARVVLAVRDRGRGEQAARVMPGRVEVRVLDLVDLGSVHRFAEEWQGDLDVLVNNAGIMAVPQGRTVDGFETQLGTNHLGHFALTNLLLPVLTDRVVTVSSGLHRRGQIVLDDLFFTRRRYSAYGAYGQSKLANLLFTLELQRRLHAQGSAVRALAAHPGFAATNLQTRSSKPLVNRLGRLANGLSPRATSGARCLPSTPRWPTCPAPATSGRTVLARCAASPPWSAGALRPATLSWPSSCGRSRSG